MPANAAFLKEIPLFSPMDDNERASVAAIMEEISFSKGQQIFHERDPGGICYILRSGRVEMSVELEGNEKLVLDLIEPGELFGELSLLDGGNRSNTAVALTDCEALVLERHEFVDFLRKQPDASLDVLAALVKRIRRGDALLRHRVQDPNKLIAEKATLGERVADAVAAFGGSWKFIGMFGAVMLGWMMVNTIFGQKFDPYPFILLNLALSALAALQAPVIMMSQNRQDAKDRIRSEADYRVNVKAEVEIAELHEKLDKIHGDLCIRLAKLNGPR
jgi:CRP/FNR family transcriptional regulator, cyclic AMP receptor protein